MYCLPKMHKIPIGTRIIVASKNWITKPLADVISETFKIIFNLVESLCRKTLFYTCFKKFGSVENSFQFVEKWIKVNTRIKAKSISTLNFTALYTIIPHNLLIKVLPKVTNFVFDSKTRCRISFPKTSVYCTSQDYGRRYFTR